MKKILYLTPFLLLFLLVNISNITYGNSVVVAVFSSLFFLNLYYAFNIYNNSLLISSCYFLLYDVITISPIGINVLAWMFARQFYMFFKKRFRETITLKYHIFCNVIFFFVSNISTILLFNQSNLEVMLYQMFITSIFMLMFYCINRILTTKNDTFNIPMSMV